MFDVASLARCLCAAAALGLPSECLLVQALENEARRRLDRFSQRDTLVVFGSTVHLHPTGPTPLADGCPGFVQHRLGKQPPSRTPFLLPSCPRLGARKPQGQQAPNRHQALRLVCHMLGQQGAVREHELGLIDELLAFCGQEASNKDLEAIFSAPLFYKNHHEHFVRSMADWLPDRADGLVPPTMALVAKYLARHRLREPRLLESIARFLLRRIEQLDSKMIQKLVFPFSRLNYRPSNHPELFPRLSSMLEQRAGSSPLAVLNILMSLFQLQHFPVAVLPRVFSPVFLDNVTSIPCGWIVHRYLSLLDLAVALEVPEYDGPRLDPRYRVHMFDGALSADRANRKYSYKGLVGEALRQLVGEECYQQDKVMPQGYCLDFLLWISPAGSVCPLAGPGPSAAAAVQRQTSEMRDMSPFRPELRDSPMAGAVLLQGEHNHSLPPSGAPCSRSTERSPGMSSPSSLVQTEPCLASATCSDLSAPGVTHSCSPTREAAREPEALQQGRLLPAARKRPLVRLPLTRVAGMARAEPAEAGATHRVVLSVNDKWHYCQNSSVLVGARAMCHRHLRLLGYHLIQLPYVEMEAVSGMEEAKRYLCRKLGELQL